MKDAEKGSLKYFKALEIAVNKLPKKYKSTVWIANTIEVAVILVVGIIIHEILKSPTIGISIVVILIVLNKLISFFLKDRFGFHSTLIPKIYWGLVNRRSFVNSFGGNDDNYLERAQEIEEEK